MKTRTWTVRVTAAAEADFSEILAWATEHFGSAQARIYAAILISAMNALAKGPKATGVRARDEIAAGLFTLHVAREGRKGRHFVMFRARNDQDQHVIEILRLLHDAMDLSRHLKTLDEGG